MATPCGEAYDVGIMSQLTNRAAQTLALGAVTLALGCDSVETRTPIDVASLGPQVGEQVPDFRLPDQNGEIRTLESILGRNGALLLFHRSADW